MLKCSCNSSVLTIAVIYKLNFLQAFFLVFYDLFNAYKSTISIFTCCRVSLVGRSMRMLDTINNWVVRFASKVAQGKCVMPGTTEQRGWGGAIAPPTFLPKRKKLKRRRSSIHSREVYKNISVVSREFRQDSYLIRGSESMGDDYDDGNTTLNITIDVHRKRYVTWQNTVTVNSVKSNQNNNSRILKKRLEN